MVLLCPNADRDIGLVTTGKVREIFNRHGIETAVCPLFDNNEHRLPTEYEYFDIGSCLDKAEAAVSLGGDGTILRIARAVAEKNIPIIAINSGNMGFMADLEPGDIGKIEDYIKGAYRTQERVMLDVALYRNGKRLFSDFALNDVIVKGISKIVSLEVLGDDDPITAFSGDGVIIATPTGSTAYSMAAGGPIVEPDASNMIVTPICPHVLAAKAFVLAPQRIVKVKLKGSKKNPSNITVDGREMSDFTQEDELVINVSRLKTRFIKISNVSFYKKVYDKLGER